MKTKNNIWIRLTTSIVIISLLYQNILLAGNIHLAPRSNKKSELQAVMICETIEKRAGYGRPIERIYLDDILKWVESSEEEFSGCRFETLPHEIKIHLASNNIIVRYFDPSKADSISGFKTKIIGPRLHRQIIQSVKALPAPTQDTKQPVTKKITPLSLLIIITASCLLISIFVFTFTSTLVLTSGAKLLFSMDIVRLLPSLAALLGGFGISWWILRQIEYGVELLRKEPAYDLLSRIVLPVKEKPKKPVRFKEYEYKVITNQPIEAIGLGIKLSDEEIQKLEKLSSIEDNAQRYMLYYGDRLAGIVTVEEMAHGIILVEVEWTSQEGKRQLSDDFIITELANRNPAGILFHSEDIDAEIIDRLLPNHTIADKKESARRLKEKVFSRLKIDDNGQYTFFAMDKLDFVERRRLYFSSFRFSSLWKMAEIDHWIYSFAGGLFFALVFSSIFAHAEAIKVLASYSFFEEYINLILTVIVAPLAARSIAKVIRIRWDPVRSRHGRRGGEDIWLSITQNMRMGWKMISTFRILAYSRIFLSGISLLLIPAIGIVILGISSAYVYLSLMFLKLVSDRIINEYEERYYKEVSEVAILFNEAAKREGYAENFHNIDSTSDILRELIYASSLLIGYGIFSCSILSPAAIPLAILAAIAMPISSFLVPTLGRDYKNYLKMWGKGFTQQSGGKVLLAEGVAMITNPDNPLVVHPRPVPVTDEFSILPWTEQLGVVIECEAGHRPTFELKNPRGPRAKKGRCVLTWPNEKLRIELISREKPLDIRDVVIEHKQDGGCLIRFYPKKGVKPSKGSPATLLQYMHNYRIFSNNPKRSREMARQRGGNDSQRTVQRELKVLKAVGLVEGDRNTGYYLPDWLRRIKIEDIIKENPELDLPSPTDIQIRTVMERVGKLVDANIMARLTYQKGKPVVFSLPKNPGEKYHLIVQDDFVSTGIFRDANEVPKHMIYVTTASRDKKQIPYPVGMATGIDIDGEGALNLEWVVTFDYDAILEEVERFRTTQFKKDTPLFAAMGIYIVYGERGEFHGQIKFLWAYLDSKLQDKSDEAILEFFGDAPRNLRRTGIGTAISEFLTSFVPVGSRIKFLIANEETKKAIWRGEIFENTLIGRWWRKLGYDKVRFSPEDLDYILEKRRLPSIESVWENPDDLGEYCIKTNNVPNQELDKGPTPVQALLFDLDGTLIPTVRDISIRALAWSYAKYILGNTEAETVERAYVIVAQTRERIAGEQGPTATVSAVRDALGITLEQQKEGKRVVSIPKLREIIKRDEEQIRLFEGLSRYYKLGVVTNLDIEMTEYTLDLLGIRHFFSVIVTPEEVGKKKKPDPIFLRTAAERLGIPCRQCVSIGDLYPQDGKPAHELGMHYIEVNNPADLVSNLEPRLMSLIDTILCTERFIDTVKSIPENNKDRKIMLALDTDIGNMTQFEIDELLKQIRDVSSLLGDIEFVAGAGDTLTGLIEDTKSRIKIDNIDVIVVTKKNKKDFDSSYHVVRTDDSRLDPGSYVPILELLTFALLINLEDNDVLLQEIYKELTGNELTSELKGQIKNSISAIPLLPPIERIPPDFYNASIEILQSA